MLRGLVIGIIRNRLLLDVGLRLFRSGILMGMCVLIRLLVRLRVS